MTLYWITGVNNTDLTELISTGVLIQFAYRCNDHDPQNYT